MARIVCQAIKSTYRKLPQKTTSALLSDGKALVSILSSIACSTSIYEVQECSGIAQTHLDVALPIHSYLAAIQRLTI